MIAIYKRELKSFFHTFVGWLFVAATLFMMGIYFTVFNMYAGYPTISYVLQSIVFLFIITIPVLTMRTLAEERKYRTDQLILTAPVSVGRIVLGKYFALVTVFAIPTVIIGITPLLLMQAGTFQTGVSYASLLGFFLYGCLGMAVGLFLSSLTESVVISAVLTMLALFLGYIMSGLCGIISDFGTSRIAEYAAKILYCFDMVGRFDALSSGYFQVESVAYYVTFTAFMLFCTTQSIQKRRYAAAGRGIKLGAYSIANILAAAALVIGINLGLNYIPDQYTSIDVTTNKIFSLTEDTKQMIGSLNEDVTIYVLADESSKDSDLDKILQQLKGLSKHIKIEYVDPVANPKFYYKYTDTELMGNSLIVESARNSAVVNYGDIYATELNYATYQSEVVGFDGEGQIVSAIARVTKDDIPKFYMVAGHDELSFDERFLNALNKENVTYETINLKGVDEVPQDAQGIILNAPVNDYSAEEADKVISYLEKGGNAFIIPTWTEKTMDNFNRILAFYGVSMVDGVIVENDRSMYYQIPYYLLPEIVYEDITAKVSGGSVFAPFSRGLTYDEEAVDAAYYPLLQTSGDSFSKIESAGADDYARGEADIDGPFVIALKIEKSTEDGGISQAVFVATEKMFTAEADDVVPGYNVKLFANIVSSLADRESSIAIPVKSYQLGNMAFRAGTIAAVNVIAVFILPGACLICGLVIWLKRRRK